jgi:putative two-component system response regulator
MELKYQILIVDDVADNIQVAMNMLQEENYDFSFAISGEEAYSLLQHNKFDLVLLDIMMPGMDGFTLCEMMKTNPLLKDIPVIFLTAKADIDSIAHGFRVGGVDYITKPFQAEELIARVRNHLELYTAKEILKYNNISLQKKVLYTEKRLLNELEETQIEIIFMLSAILESISDETGQHVRRIAEISRLLAHYHPSLTAEDEKVIYHASPMHDVGKIVIPPAILNKHGALTEEEFELIKTHPRKAHQFLKGASRKILKAAHIIAYEHHEKWDGSGYPRGLKGEEINIFGRIVALADVFDALTHDRVYKKAWSFDDAAAYIIERSAKQFDPQVVAVFEENLDLFRKIV